MIRGFVKLFFCIWIVVYCFRKVGCGLILIYDDGKWLMFMILSMFLVY